MCTIVNFILKERLQNSIKLLENYKQGTLPEAITNKQLWEAQKIKQVQLSYFMFRVIKGTLKGLDTKPEFLIKYYQ